MQLNIEGLILNVSDHCVIDYRLMKLYSVHTLLYLVLDNVVKNHSNGQ